MPDVRRFFLLSLLALVAAFGLAACGGDDDPSFDRAAAADQAQEEVEDADGQAEDATCDEPDPIEEGEEFECEVELENGEEVTVDGEITNSDGDFRLDVDSDAVAEAQGGGEGGEATTPTEEDGGGEATGVPAELEETIRDFQNAVIDNDASGACVELSDPALEREFGGFTECLSEFESTAPEGSSRGDDLVIEEVTVSGDTATARVRNPGTGVTSEIKLIDEGGTTGWAIDEL
jgi:hypothetical protein